LRNALYITYNSVDNIQCGVDLIMYLKFYSTNQPYPNTRRQELLKIINKIIILYMFICELHFFALEYYNIVSYMSTSFQIGFIFVIVITKKVTDKE
jgi:hypothetical protein